MRVIAYLITTILSINSISAQVSITHAVKVGTTPTLRSLHGQESASKLQKKLDRKQQKQIPNFIGRGAAPYLDNPNSLPKGQDPLLQRTLQRRMMGDTVAPIVVLEGLEFNPFVPDPCGEKNKDYYVQVINASTMMVWDNDGIPLLAEPFDVGTLWESLNRVSGGDPIILFDEATERWMITEFPPFPSPFVLIAISEDDDPLGNYTVYEYGTQGFPDYPKWSIWGDAIIVTTNEGGDIPIYALNKDQLFGGEETVTVVRTTVPRVDLNRLFQVLTPVDYNGPLDAPITSPPMIMRMNDDEWGEVTEDRLEMYTFDIDWDNPSLSELHMAEIPVAPFDGDFCSLGDQASLNCVPQPNGVGVDGLPHVLMNQIHYRNFGSHESIVVAHAADATGDDLAGIRWYELRKDPRATEWSIYQQGMHAPDDLFNRFMPAIAIDQKGNIGLGYNGSSTEVFPSLYVTGRRNGDPLGEMTMGETLVFAGGTSVTRNRNRFGDYSSMVVDTDDGKTFWFTGEYGGTDGDYATGIVSFALDNDSIDLRVVDLAEDLNNDVLGTEDLIFSIRNTAKQPVDNYTYGYSFKNTTVTAKSSASLAPGESIEVEFVDALSFTDLTRQDLQIFVNTADDQFAPNDTLRTSIQKIASYDLSISASPATSDIQCGRSADAAVIVSNMGFRTIDSFAIEITFASGEVVSDRFNRTIEGGRSTPVSLVADSAMPDGTTDATVVVTLLGPSDQVVGNDTSVISFTREMEGEPTLIQFDLDEFPNETSYELFDADNNVIASDGPFVGDLFAETFCLDAEACYTFVIYDSFGDGIFDNPDLSIIQTSTDSTLVSLQGLDFSSQFVVEFCLQATCGVPVQTVIVDATDAQSSDGSIIVNPGISGSNYVISIDGGTTFGSGSTFDNLAAGTYEVVVYDSLLMCSNSETIVINSCSGQVQIQVLNTSSNSTSDGAIEIILPADLRENATYSLDGGTPQEEAVFAGLEEGEYSITVTYGNGCSETVTGFVMSGISSTTDNAVPVFVEVSPNPTDGRSMIEVSGIKDGFALAYTLYDMLGNSVSSSRLAKYDGKFVGELRIYHLPAGVYLLQLHHSRVSRAIKIVKQ